MCANPAKTTSARPSAVRPGDEKHAGRTLKEPACAFASGVLTFNMVLGVVAAGMLAMFASVAGMARRGAGVMTGLLMVASVVVSSGLTVVMRCLVMMVSGVAVMFRALVLKHLESPAVKSGGMPARLGMRLPIFRTTTAKRSGCHMRRSLLFARLAPRQAGSACAGWPEPTPGGLGNGRGAKEF
jgi:hypothetical protein